MDSALRAGKESNGDQVNFQLDRELINFLAQETKMQHQDLND